MNLSQENVRIRLFEMKEEDSTSKSKPQLLCHLSLANRHFIYQILNKREDLDVELSTTPVTTLSVVAIR